MHKLSKLTTMLLLSACLFPVEGCANLFIDSAISDYESVAPQVKLGDPKGKVLTILEPTQSGLPKGGRKGSESNGTYLSFLGWPYLRASFLAIARGLMSRG